MSLCIEDLAHVGAAFLKPARSVVRSAGAALLPVLASAAMLVGCASAGAGAALDPASTSTSTSTSSPVSDAEAEEAPRDLWLEDSGSDRTRAWVAARNAESEARLATDPVYERERRRFESLGGGSHTSDYLNGGLLHRLQADAAHPLGLWRVQAVSAAARALIGDGWQTMLDLDALARREGVRWSLPLWWVNPICDITIGPRCALALSPDGGDRTVLREFDLRQRTFVEGGFRIDRPARTYVHWVDADHLLLAGDFGPGSLTAAGYARQARLWRRGTPPSEARLLFEAAADTVLFIPHDFAHDHGRLFVAEVWRQQAGAPTWWLIDPAAPAGASAWRYRPPVDLVRYRGLTGIVDGRLIALTAAALTRGGVTWPAGSLLALPLPALSAAASQASPSAAFALSAVPAVSTSERHDEPDGEATPAALAIEPIFVPGPQEAIDPVFHIGVSHDALWFGVMHDVSGQLYRAHRSGAVWQLTRQPVPPFGAVRILTGEVAPSAALVRTESLLSPPQTSVRRGADVQVVDQAPAAFDPAPYRTRQYVAISRDGTRVPYFVTGRADVGSVVGPASRSESDEPSAVGSAVAAGPGSAPESAATRAAAPLPAALLTAYGGFGISFLPTYLNPEFQSDLVWPLLAHGGIHVLVNIRGGGEFGPRWHQAAQRRKRERGIDDLVAVAEDLVARKLADPARLGFIGASNGGLLAAATAVRRPALFKAVVADVPLTDMLRFHELLTGAVWIDEYGDPRDPADRAVLRAWSPLQQLRANVRYPEMLITTSASDDRVHPGHARRFAERLRELGQPVLFHESADSGHGGAAALDAAARRRALQATYLLQALGLTTPPRTP